MPGRIRGMPEMPRVVGLSLMLVAALAAALPLAAPARSAESSALQAVRQQLQTAAFHATNAANQAALSAAVLHLGHALNCIEGPKGTNFDTSWGNVCEGQGQGIAVDLQGLPQARQVRLLVDAADALALAGVKSGDLTATRNAARGVAALLELVLNSL